MTSISKNNYEVFFLDYIEGRLDAAETSALLQFLETHPELKEELDSIELIKLEPDHKISFESKDALKKPLFKPFGKIDQQNYEEFFIAAAENDLSYSDKSDLNIFLQKNPDLAKELETIKLCRLQPETKLIFENKQLLKKNIVLPFLSQRIYYIAAVAASLALLIGLGIIFRPGTQPANKITYLEPTTLNDQFNIEPEIASDPGISKMPVKTTEVDAAQTITIPAPNYEPDIKNNKPKNEIYLPGSRELTTPVFLASLSAPDKIFTLSPPVLSKNLRQYFSNYYQDIAVAQNIRHAESAEEDQLAEKLLAQGTNVIKEIFQPGEQEIEIKPEKLNIWNIADAGINGFARLTGADLEFRKRKNDEGKVVAFALESQSMLISKNLRRNKQ